MPADPQQLTPWFAWNQVPARPGVYMTNLKGLGTGYSHWNGSRWGNQYDSVGKAHDRRRDEGMQGKTWRGLKEQK